MNPRGVDPMEMVTDRAIRRGLGFAALAIGTVMVSLSFDLPLALRCGADLLGVTSLIMLLAAWHSPRRDMRHSEAWAVLSDLQPEMVRRIPRQELQRRLREVLRKRLVWHAQRVAGAAVALWALTLLVMAARALRGEG